MNKIFFQAKGMRYETVQVVIFKGKVHECSLSQSYKVL